MTYDQMKSAVLAYYSDKSRPQGATRNGLEDLRDELDMLIDSLDDDEARANE